MFILEACNGNSMSFATWVSNMQLWGLADRTGEKNANGLSLAKSKKLSNAKMRSVGIPSAWK